MTEREYKRHHIMLWCDIVDYLHEVKRGNEKIYYESIADLKSALLNTQDEDSGIYDDCYACEFALTENGNIIDKCVRCPLIRKLGCICYNQDSGAYALLKEAYKSKDYKKAIRLAIRIRDAWREVK